MINNGNGGPGEPPCAACKFGRKKSCVPDCVLRENYPAEKKREFDLVLKIFGIVFLKKIMNSVDTQEKRDQVAESIEWEAKAWTDDPLRGPYGQFKRLEQQLEEQREYSNTLRHHTSQVEVPENHRQDKPQVAESNASPTIENANISPVMGSYISTSLQLSPETEDELMPNYFLNTIGGPDNQIGLLEKPLSGGSQDSFYTSPTIGTDFNVNNTGNQNGTDIHQLNSMNPQLTNNTSPDQSSQSN